MTETVPAHPFQAGIVWVDEKWVPLRSGPADHAQMLDALTAPRRSLPEQYDDAISWPQPLLLHTGRRHEG